MIDEDAATAIEARVAATRSPAARGCSTAASATGAQLTPAVLDHVPPEHGARGATRRSGRSRRSCASRDLDEAIAVANGTPYGLSSGVCTFDWRAITRCVRELRAGTVNIREVPGWRTELTPFGGIGDSGLGVKEGVREAIRAMTSQSSTRCRGAERDVEGVREMDGETKVEPLTAVDCTVNEILWACESMVGLPYDGEPVDQLEHALQCAAMARQEGDPAFVVARSCTTSPRALPRGAGTRRLGPAGPLVSALAAALAEHRPGHALPRAFALDPEIHGRARRRLAGQLAVCRAWAPRRASPATSSAWRWRPATR